MPHSHHSHSGQFCRHAKDQLEDVVKEAIRQGFEVYGLTEHAPRYRLEDLYPEEADLAIEDLHSTYLSFLKTAQQLKRKYASQITLLIGLESDFITELDLKKTRGLFDSHTEIDYIVGSVHHVNGIPIDFDREAWLRAVYAAGRGEEGSMMQAGPDSAPEAVQPDRSIPQLQPAHIPTLSELRPFILSYLDQQLRMIQALQPEVIGHFDLFRLWTPQLDVKDPVLNPDEDRGVWEAIQRNVNEVVRYGGLFELNTAAYRKGWDTAYPSSQIAKLIMMSGGKFCFSDDSHGTAQVGLNYGRLKTYCDVLSLTTISYLQPIEETERASDVMTTHRVLLDRSPRVNTLEANIAGNHPFWAKHA